jgi:hypothetical protein
MSSTVLSQSAAAADVLYAAGGLLAGSGISSTGDITGVVARFQQVVVKDLNPNDITDAGVFLFNSAGPTETPPRLQQEVIITVPSNNQQGNDTGCLNIYTKSDNSPIVARLVSTQVSGEGSVGPPVILGTQAIWGMTSAFQSGRATIAIGGTTVAVPNTAILAGSVIMLTGEGVPDATATTFDAVITAGTGFVIETNAAATAAKNVNWFVARY